MKRYITLAALRIGQAQQRNKTPSSGILPLLLRASVAARLLMQHAGALWEPEEHKRPVCKGAGPTTTSA